MFKLIIVVLLSLVCSFSLDREEAEKCLNQSLKPETKEKLAKFREVFVNHTLHPNEIEPFIVTQENYRLINSTSRHIIQDIKNCKAVIALGYDNEKVRESLLYMIRTYFKKPTLFSLIEDLGK